MVGLQYLKFAFDESDESVVGRWIENPYWQYFRGFTHMRHEPPIDPSSMSRWRKRVGAERLELLLKETIELAVREKRLPKRHLARITVAPPFTGVDVGDGEVRSSRRLGTSRATTACGAASRVVWRAMRSTSRWRRRRPTSASCWGALFRVAFRVGRLAPAGHPPPTISSGPTTVPGAATPQSVGQT